MERHRVLLGERGVDHKPVRRLVWMLGRALAVDVQVQLECRRLGAGRVDDELEPPRGHGELADRFGDRSLFGLVQRPVDDGDEVESLRCGSKPPSAPEPPT